MTEENNVPVVQDEQPNLPTTMGYQEAIKSLTTMPDVNPDVVHAFLDAQERILDREAKMAFIKAKHAVRRDLPTIVKNKFNDQTKSSYANFEAIKKAVDPILDKHGMSDSYTFDYPEDGVTITTCILTHDLGHEERYQSRVCRDDVGIAGKKNKTNVHGDASAASYGQRYSLGAGLGLKTSKDDDGNAAGLNPITEKQRDKIQALVDDTGADTQQFCEFMGVSSLSDISTIKYADAISSLQAKKIKLLEDQDDNS